MTFQISVMTFQMSVMTNYRTVYFKRERISSSFNHHSHNSLITSLHIAPCQSSRRSRESGFLTVFLTLRPVPGRSWQRAMRIPDYSLQQEDYFAVKFLDFGVSLAISG
ncbi:unnamed protein product [Arctogadus glacialis]